MTAFNFSYKLEMKLLSWLEFISAIRLLSFVIVPHKSDQTGTHVLSQHRWDKVAFNGITFSELLKNNKKGPAPDWSEVSWWWKQIDRCSRWIQSQLIRGILRDHRPSLNTGHPLPFNPSQIPNTPTQHSSRATHTEPGRRNASEFPAAHVMEASTVKSNERELVLPMLAKGLCRGLDSRGLFEHFTG